MTNERHGDQRLEAFRQSLLTMAGYAEDAVRRSVRAVLERNDVLSRAVEADDRILDDYEVRMDETALTLLARAPLAKDLRLILVGMKISHDLERVGDEATKIARRAQALNREAPLAAPDVLRRLEVMGAAAVAMLKEALDALVGRDTGKAREIVARDREVDRDNKEIHRDLMNRMANRPDELERALHLMVVSKSLERIADHATNIAEEVVYLYESRDIRHGLKSEVRAA